LKDEICGDDMKCFHVAAQKTCKFVVMDHINFEDHALIKRWWACKKNECDGREVQGQKKWGDCRKQFVFITEVMHVFKVLEFTIT
jgi:hypothetical protein